MSMIQSLRRLAETKANEETTFAQLLGKDDLLFWAKIGEETEKLEFIKLLSKVIKEEDQKDFLLYIIENCTKEAKLIKARKSQKDEMIKKSLIKSDIEDKIEAKVLSIL